MACKIVVTITSTGEQGESITNADVVKIMPFAAAAGLVQQLTVAIIQLEAFGIIDSATIYIKPVDEGVE